MDRQQLCTALRTQWYLESDEIDAIFADWDFFCPYLKQALARKAQLRGVQC